MKQFYDIKPKWNEVNQASPRTQRELVMVGLVLVVLSLIGVLN